MDNKEARSFFSVHRAGETGSDPRLAEAERQAAADPELAHWWADEQEVDRAIAAKLAAVPIPAELKARFTVRSSSERRYNTAVPWRRAALLAAAAIVALAVFFGSWRGPFQPAASLADYRDEMASFIKLTPSLELETSELTEITNHLAESGAPSQIEIPAALRKLDPIGCRTLRFRGHNVALICFKQSGGRIAHLMVVDRAALRGVSKSSPEFAERYNWMTAAWTEGDSAYLLAVQGDQSTAEQFL